MAGVTQRKKADRCAALRGPRRIKSAPESAAIRTRFYNSGHATRLAVGKCCFGVRTCGNYFYGSYDTPPFDAQTIRIHYGVGFRRVEPVRPMVFPESALVG